MSAFQFTNAYSTARYVAIYSQQSDAALINFSGIAAGISLDVYITMLFCWCALVALFVLIENVRPAANTTYNWWNIGAAIMPCLNCQAPGLEHSNSISRCVAIITASIFVLLCTTYYQTLLLSKTCVRHKYSYCKLGLYMSRSPRMFMNFIQTEPVEHIHIALCQ